MKKNLFSMLILCLIGLQSVFAQSREVSGVVTSADDGMSIPGVSVVVKGTTIGTSTDFDGKYTISVPADGTLVFSFVGMKDQEVLVTSNTINVVMESESIGMDEVIVVAYGTAKKSSFTGSVAGISEEKLSRVQASDPAKALAGNVAGVRIVSTSGKPGGGAKIRIRGIGSINASSEPLIIVDGAPYDGNLTSISTSDIKSMNVLKDAASAALYGARGANGVIVITTKTGEKGASIKFNAKVGMNYRGVEEYDVMTSPKEYYETAWESIKNHHQYSAGLSAADAAIAASSDAADGLYDLAGYNIYNVPNNQIVGVDGKLNPNANIKYADKGWNDWEDHLYDPQMRQEYNLSMSKVVDKSKLYFSLGYLEDKGYTPNSKFQRINSKLSFDTDVTKWLTFKVSNLFSNTESDQVQEGTAYSNSFSWMRNIAPIYPVYTHDAAGVIVTDLNNNRLFDFGEAREDVNGARAYGAQTNPVATQNLDAEKRTNYYLTNNFIADLKLSENLTFSATATLYNNWYNYDDFTTPTGGSGLAYNGIASKYRQRTTTLNMNQIIRWSKEYDDFGINAMVGHETYDKDIVSMNGQKSNFLDPANIEFSNAAKITELDSYERGYNLEGYFAQVTLDFADKYYLSGSYRRDGSSVFYEDNRWGDFYSVGASWRLKEETFLADVDFLDNLKLKASYGTQGNDNLLLPGSTRRAYTPYKSLINITSDGTSFGTQKLYLGNKDVTWETNNNFNVGVEFTLFGGRLSGEGEFFHKKTNDLLFNLPVPKSTGYQSKPTNIGDMKNVGYEVALNGEIFNTPEFKWNIGVNFTHFKNEITKLPEEFRADGITRGSQILKEGGSIYDFWMVEYAGVDETNGDALFNMYNKDTELFELTNDPDNATFDPIKSKKMIGNAIPDLTGGFSTSVEYKDFDLSMQFAFQIGGKVSDGVYSRLMHVGDIGSNWHNDINNRWTPTNTKTDVPRIEYNNRKLSYSSDRFITDASYLSFGNLTLGYTFPKHMVERLKLSSLRVYFVADNVALWSKRKGLDPRMSFSGIISDSRYAPIRTVSCGLVVNL